MQRHTDQMLFKEPEARMILGGMSRDKFFQCIRAGQLKPVHVGRSLYITKTALEDFVESLSSDGVETPPSSI